MPRYRLALFLLATTQIIGWGAVGVLPVIAARVAAEFGAALPSVFLGTSVMYVVMALAAPKAGRAFRLFGTRQVMAVGASLIGLGLFVLGLSPNLQVFWLSWALMGAGGRQDTSRRSYRLPSLHA